MTTPVETLPPAPLPPRTLGDERMKVAFLATVPAGGLEDLTAAELNAALDVSCRLAKDGTYFRAAASENITEAAICEPASTQALGPSNYEAQANVFRYFSETTTGSPDPSGDALFAALRQKGSTGVFVTRLVNKKWDEPWAQGDEYSAFQVESDNWIQQEDTSAGYVKATVPLIVKDGELNGIVVA